MKNRLYILLIILLSVGFVGCHKVDINPHHPCNEDDSIENNEKGRSSGDGFERDEDNDGGGITDPNHDEDEDRQIKT